MQSTHRKCSKSYQRSGSLQTHGFYPAYSFILSLEPQLDSLTSKLTDLPPTRQLYFSTLLFAVCPLLCPHSTFQLQNVLNNTHHLCSYKLSKLRGTHHNGCNCAVKSSQHIWAGQYKKCAVYSDCLLIISFSSYYLIGNKAEKITKNTFDFEVGISLKTRLFAEMNTLLNPEYMTPWRKK